MRKIHRRNLSHLLESMRESVLSGRIRILWCDMSKDRRISCLYTDRIAAIIASCRLAVFQP